ncbi:cytochrome P450 [Actinomadura luteofluorescens]|uniref:cytochrome P450 n=1 Tax=Actinomadura luteofluorescens TaxID=46163 RepID=UPI00363D2DE6
MGRGRRGTAGDDRPRGHEGRRHPGGRNRDPRRFHRPDRFDPDRPYTAPLTFGAGGHFCLGAPLSRLEARIALPRLLHRFPRIRPAGEPVRRDSWVGRGIDHFPIAID